MTFMVAVSVLVCCIGVLLLFAFPWQKCVHVFLICQTKYFQAIMAEGKQHALAIGFTKMSAKDMWVIF
jgi:hypothetical protein